MGKRKFSGLEVTLIVMFLLVAVVAIALVVVLATGEPAVITNEDEEVPNFVPQCPDIVLGERVDCFPESGASMYKCVQRGCCWRPMDDSNAPWCFFPANQGYEVISEENPSGFKRDTVLKRLAAPPMFQSHIEELVCHEEMQTPNRFRFQITDSKKPRFEVPHEHVKPPSSPPGGALKYEVELLKKPFGLKLRRADTKKIL